MRAWLSKWGIPVLLFLATTLNYLDRQTLGILAPIVQREMGLDNEALGWLFAVFYWAYTFSQFGVGLLLDRANLRWAYGLGVLAWSAACALTGLSRGFWSLIVFRLLLGVMESVNWPASLRIVSRVLEPADRPLGNGIFTSGTSIGALIAPGLILGISATFGWRWALVAVGSLGALWFVAWLTFTGSLGADSHLPVSGSGYGEILRTPQFWRVFAVTILILIRLFGPARDRGETHAGRAAVKLNAECKRFSRPGRARWISVHDSPARSTQDWSRLSTGVRRES